MRNRAIAALLASLICASAPGEPMSVIGPDVG